MSEYQILTVFAAFAFAYSLIASRLEKTPVNGALVYVVMGMLCGPHLLGLVDLEIDQEGVSRLAEIALAICLFSDSSNANLTVLRRVEAIPVRLLMIGLPLTIAFGLALAWLIFGDLSFYEIALIATMLAPTDAALGKAVVTNPAVPAKVRESLNVESGLNDGICVPVILFFIALTAGTVEAAESTSMIVELTCRSDRHRHGDRPCACRVRWIRFKGLCGPRLGRRYLVAIPHHRTRLALFWFSTVAGRQRLHRFVRGRFDIRSVNEAAQRTVLGSRRRHRRRCGAGDLVYVRDDYPGDSDTGTQLAGLGLCSPQPDVSFACCPCSCACSARD